MEQQKTNQERGRKRLRSKTKAILDSQPSKAPGQDQEVREFLGPDTPEQHASANDQSAQQGVSNRPANEEHPFPASGEPPAEPAAEPAADTSVPQQQGGNRGGV
jgi:hypothetical protein